MWKKDSKVAFFANEKQQGKKKEKYSTVRKHYFDSRDIYTVKIKKKVVKIFTPLTAIRWKQCWGSLCRGNKKI